MWSSQEKKKTLHLDLLYILCISSLKSKKWSLDLCDLQLLTRWVNSRSDPTVKHLWSEKTPKISPHIHLTTLQTYKSWIMDFSLEKTILHQRTLCRSTPTIESLISFSDARRLPRTHMLMAGTKQPVHWCLEDKQGFRHPTWNECMGWFAHTICWYCESYKFNRGSNF